MERTREELYRVFRETRQEPLRLAAALEGFFRTGIDEAERGIYGTYLRKRIRPAAEKLIGDEDTVKLERLAKCGWFGVRELDGFIRTARERGKTASLLWLLHYKDRLRSGDGTGRWQRAGTGVRPDSVHAAARLPEISADQARLAKTVLVSCRNDLYRWFPSLDAAFAGVVYRKCAAGEPVRGIGTDGDAFICEPQFVLEMYAENPARLRRGYLHMLLHCLYLHPFAGKGRGAVDAGGTDEQWNPVGVYNEDVRGAQDLFGAKDEGVREGAQDLSGTENKAVRRQLWDLACDIAVEQIIEREGIAALADDEGEEHEAGGLRRTDVLRELQHIWENMGAERVREAECIRADMELPLHPGKQKCEPPVRGVLSAEQLYQLLCRGVVPYTVEELGRVFRFDDHTLWRTPGKGDRDSGRRRKWEKIRAHAGVGGKAGNLLAGLGEGSDNEEAGAIRRSSFDYRRFLSRFTVAREEVGLDTESFDYIYYSYGMRHYGNLPLIEPLEYREVNRLEELVIAIDTSGSCSAEMVREFLAGTYAILSRKENFFRKMEVRLIQCDCAIQSVIVIHSEKEWRQAAEHIVIEGRGGTDFTPVFRYVRAQREKKELRRLRALIYFTDGDGVYPAEKPDYETAFVFVRRTRGMELVPPWARTLVAD